MKKLLLLISGLVILSCSTENSEIYTLDTYVDPPGAGEVSPSEGEYDDGEEVTVAASANEGWVFSGWQGDHDGGSNPATIVMNSDKSITALFEVREYDLTLETDGNGEIQEQIISSKTESYPEGTAIQLTAVPDDGWKFVEWSGDLSGDENPAQITVEGDMTISASFEADASSQALESTVFETGSSARLNSIQFLTDELGWVGGEGLIAKTTDGGNTWTFQMEDDFVVTDLLMINENVGFAAGAVYGDFSGDQGIYRTTDGGDTWLLAYMTDDEPRSLYFTDENTGWAAGVNDLIVKTSDGGETWTVQDQFIGAFGGEETFWINDLFFLDENTGWGAGHYSPADNRLIVHTEDGGDTWEVVYDYLGSPFNFIHMINEEEGLTGSGREIYKLLNKGVNTSLRLSHPTFSSAQDVAFKTSSHGYLIGRNFNSSSETFFYETTDAGATWTQLEIENLKGGTTIDIGTNYLWTISGPSVVKVEI